MKTWQWLLYGSLLVVAEYQAFQEYDRLNHLQPKGNYYGLPPEAVFLVPILLVLVLHYIIGLLGQVKPQATDMGIPVAAVFIANPKSQQDYSQYNPVFDEVTDRFLFLVNAQRSYKQKHKGERILAGLRFSAAEKRKWDGMMHYYYLQNDHLSREEIAQYMLKEGDIILQNYDYNISFSNHPQLIHSAEIVIYEMRSAPKTVDDLAVALYSAGHGAQATELIEAQKPPQVPFKGR